MLVDIIIPAYNPGPYIHEAIKSAYKQNYRHINVIVVDDHSDEDLSYLRDLYPNLTYHRNEKNLGPSISRNIAIEMGKGELISLLDADDIMESNKIRLSVDRFKTNDIGMTCGNYKIFVNRNRFTAPFYKAPIKVDYQALLKVNLVASGSTTIRRDVMKKVGGFDPRYKICEDYDLWIRVAELYPIEYIHEILYYYSILQGSNSLTQRADIQKDHLSNIQQIVAESKKRVENLDRSNKK
jgi:glycosyltransferase involved in cell wall biosynthesis